jgi:heme-degrading monooxygenase HmoA
MAIALVQEFPIVGDDRTTTNYDSFQERLGTESSPGLILHTAGFDEDDGVFRIFTVWESDDDWIRFREERLSPLIEQAVASGGNPPPVDHTYRLHHVVPSA